MWYIYIHTGKTLIHKTLLGNFFSVCVFGGAGDQAQAGPPACQAHVLPLGSTPRPVES